MQSKIIDRKNSKFYVNQLNFKQPVQEKKIPPLPHHQIKSKSLNTSKTLQKTERNPEKKEVNSKGGYRKSLGENIIKNAKLDLE